MRTAIGRGFSRVFAALFALSVLFVSTTVLAEKAVVVVFEAHIYVEPSTDSRIIGFLIEGTKVSVSEVVSNGWRQVRLDNGSTGWLVADQLQKWSKPPPTVMRRVAAPPIVDCPRIVASSAPARPLLYIRDAEHLADIARQDPVVLAGAEDLLSQARTADIVSWSTTIVGAGLILFGLVEAGTCNFGCEESTGVLLLSGVLVGTIGPLVGTSLSPSRSALIDSVNQWNSRHADEPIAILP